MKVNRLFQPAFWLTRLDCYALYALIVCDVAAFTGFSAYSLGCLDVRPFNSVPAQGDRIELLKTGVIRKLYTHAYDTYPPNNEAYCLYKEMEKAKREAGKSSAC